MQANGNDVWAVSGESTSKSVALADPVSNIAVLDEAWLEDVSGGIKGAIAGGVAAVKGLSSLGGKKNTSVKIDMKNSCIAFI